MSTPTAISATLDLRLVLDLRKALGDLAADAQGSERAGLYRLSDGLRAVAALVDATALPDGLRISLSERNARRLEQAVQRVAFLANADTHDDAFPGIWAKRQAIENLGNDLRRAIREVA
jgi:hypothetical protein